MIVQTLAPFSRWKLLALSAPLVVMAALLWAQLPGIDEYVGHRLSTEYGLFLYYSSMTIITAFLPLVVWHVWNLITHPSALYTVGGRLFIYWAWFQSVRISNIIDAVDLGKAGPLGDSVRLSVKGRRDLIFQTTFMAKSGREVAEAIKNLTNADPV